MLYLAIGSVGLDQRFLSPTKLIAAEILAGVSSAASLSICQQALSNLLGCPSLPSAHAVFSQASRITNRIWHLAFVCLQQYTPPQGYLAAPDVPP